MLFLPCVEKRSHFESDQNLLQSKVWNQTEEFHSLVLLRMGSNATNALSIPVCVSKPVWSKRCSMPNVARSLPHSCFVFIVQVIFNLAMGPQLFGCVVSPDFGNIVNKVRRHVAKFSLFNIALTICVKYFDN